MKSLLNHSLCFGWKGFSSPGVEESRNLSSVECASKVAASLNNETDEPRKKFNSFAYDHETQTCIVGNVSPFSTNFNTTSQIKRTDITTGSLYVIRHCLPKRKCTVRKADFYNKILVIISYNAKYLIYFFWIIICFLKGRTSQMISLVIGFLLTTWILTRGIQKQY